MTRNLTVIGALILFMVSENSFIVLRNLVYLTYPKTQFPYVCEINLYVVRKFPA